MSGKGGKKRSSALAQLESHLKGPKDELQELLYPTSGTVDYEKLRCVVWICNCCWVRVGWCGGGDRRPAAPPLSVTGIHTYVRIHI